MTTEEWKRRQQEAAEQARQMHKQARSYDSPREETSCLPLTPPPLTRRHPAHVPEPAMPEPTPEPCPATDKPSSTGLSSLLADPDRALLLLLIVLLLKNNASMELICALCYLVL